jgi:hypothetical protein
MSAQSLDRTAEPMPPVRSVDRRRRCRRATASEQEAVSREVGLVLDLCLVDTTERLDG